MENQNGNIALKLPSGESYEGSVVNGVYHGYGKFTYIDGTVYTGRWREGKEHGQGILVTADGERYEGNW